MRECRKTKGIYGRVEKKQQIAVCLSANRHFSRIDIYYSHFIDISDLYIKITVRIDYKVQSNLIKECLPLHIN